jgi:hypothetical protein
VPTNEADDSRATVAEAWARLARAVTDADAILDEADVPDRGVALAEGYDYWAQVVTFGLRRELHYAEPDNPLFHRIGLDTKIGFDNPDNVYEIAKINPEHQYRVTGTRGTAQFLEFSVSVGFPGVVATPRTISKLDTTEIDVGADGSIELVVGGPPRARNWFAVDADATSFLVRQVFGAWRTDDVPGDFRIERIGGAGASTPPLTPEVMATRLHRTAEFVETQTRYWIDYVRGLYARIPANAFEAPGLQGRELVQVNAARAFFCWGLYDLGPDDALVVEVAAPEEDTYLGFHLVNYWLQSLDFVSRVTSRNARQAHVDADGAIRLVLAHSDPGVPNWLDVTGHPRGGMLFRAALAPSAPQPSATVVPLGRVRDALPSGTPVVTPEQRAAEIAERRAHVAARFRW